MHEQAFAELITLQPGAITYYMRDVGEDALDPYRIWKGRLAVNYLTHIPPYPGFIVEGLEEGLEMLYEPIHIRQVIMYSKAPNKSTGNSEKSANSS